MAVSEQEQITADNAIARYADLVYRLALSQIKNRADADDVFQEVFIRLVSHIHKLQSWDHVKAWLITVTVNCVKKHFHLYWNRNVLLMEDSRFVQDQGRGYVLEEEHPVTAAVGKLPYKYRLTVYLFYYEQLSIAEIGEVTVQKTATVKSQLYRAREMLKEMLEGDPDL